MGTSAWRGSKTSTRCPSVCTEHPSAAPFNESTHKKLNGGKGGTMYHTDRRGRGADGPVEARQGKAGSSSNIIPSRTKADPGFSQHSPPPPPPKKRRKKSVQTLPCLPIQQRPGSHRRFCESRRDQRRTQAGTVAGGLGLSKRWNLGGATDH